MTSRLTADHSWSPLWLFSHHVSISLYLNIQWVSISCRFTHLSRAGWPAEAWLAVRRSASFLSFWFLGCWCDDAPLSNARVSLCDAGSETSEETQSYFTFLWACVCVCVCVLFVYVFCLCVCLKLMIRRFPFLWPLKPTMGVLCWYIKRGRKGGSRITQWSAAAPRARMRAHCVSVCVCVCVCVCVRVCVCVCVSQQLHTVANYWESSSR